jgi:hypothetical protein
LDQPDNTKQGKPSWQAFAEAFFPLEATLIRESINVVNEALPQRNEAVAMTASASAHAFLRHAGDSVYDT